MNKKIITVYISSPHTDGLMKQIYSAEKLIELGYIPFAPLLFFDSWGATIPHAGPYWIRQHLYWEQKCDAVLRLPGDSDGADREVARAQDMGKPVFFGLEQVKQNE